MKIELKNGQLTIVMKKKFIKNQLKSRLKIE